MPWKVSGPMNDRMRFVVRLEQGERMTDLCREFGISRKTGYKFEERYKALGPIGLYDEPRAPERIPHRTSDEVVARIVGLKKEHPTWGPKKVKVELERREVGVRIPAPSTVGEILLRHGLVTRRKRNHTTPPAFQERHGSKGPNDLWCVDFKGQFRLGSGDYCYPLTVTDHFSRYLIGCEGLDSTQGGPAKAVFQSLFQKYGLPDAIRTDNGPPFASRGLAGLTALSGYWLKLGIRLERIEPGHPEQNGRHERMHLTLKQATTRPAAKNMLQQQEQFDRFEKEFNNERPHEGIEMKRPADLYQPSSRSLPTEIREPEYPLHDQTRTVNRGGHVLFEGRGTSFFLGYALVGEVVGLREVDDGRWLVSFATLDLGTFDEKTRRFETATQKTKEKEKTNDARIS